MAETASSHRSGTTHRLMRAEREFLRLIHPVIYDDGHRLNLVRQVKLTSHCRTAIWSRLNYPGLLRSGPVFGYGLSGDGVLTVGSITEGGSPLFVSQHHPFDLCPEYLLGYSELMRQLAPTWDWYGQWVIHPDGTLGSAAWRHQVLEEFQDRSLIREDAIVMFLGVLDGQLAVKAFLLLDGSFEEVPTEME